MNRPSSHRLSLLRLVMMNIIAVDSLRNISITAKAGWSIVTFFLLGGGLFLVPCALLTAELATGNSKNGGIYLWTKEAFGPRIGFIVLWIQWIYNLVWFPSICGFFAGIFAYLLGPYLGINPDLLTANPWYITSMSLATFWGATAVNLRGLKTSSTISVIGAVVGTLLPMLLIIGLALFWIFKGENLGQPLSLHAFVPSQHQAQNWPLFLTVMFSLFGLEMSSIHAGNVDNPQKNFPRALLISGAVILLSQLFANIAVFTVTPGGASDINMITGFMGAFHYFFEKFHLSWMTPIIACTLILGAFAGLSAWIMGLSRAFNVAAADGLLPKKFASQNRHQAPEKILLLQGILFSLFCLSYLLMPSVHAAYWFLSALTAQLAVLGYIGMFLAAILLKKRTPNQPGQFILGQGTTGTTLASIMGTIGCLIAFAAGFLPTEEVTFTPWKFSLLLLAGIVIALLLPFGILEWMSLKKQPH